MTLMRNGNPGMAGQAGLGALALESSYEEWKLQHGVAQDIAVLALESSYEEWKLRA